MLYKVGRMRDLTGDKLPQITIQVSENITDKKQFTNPFCYDYYIYVSAYLCTCNQALYTISNILGMVFKFSWVGIRRTEGFAKVF